MRQLDELELLRHEALMLREKVKEMEPELKWLRRNYKDLEERYLKLRDTDDKSIPIPTDARSWSRFFQGY